MSSKRLVFVALGATVLFACLGRVTSTADGTTPPTCDADQRIYNGSCVASCTTSAECPAGTRCMAIDESDAACLDDTQCAYLASDTQCLGTGYTYQYVRFGLEAIPYPSTPDDANPYDTTPYVDPYFLANPYYDTGYTSPAGYGCEGDATFVKIPATGDVACGQTHAIVRCRRSGGSCVLVAGTTVDLVSP